MKNSKKWLVGLLSALLVVPLAACDPEPDNPTSFTVTFDYGYDGSPDDLEVVVEKGERVAAPARPSRVNMYFLGWYEGAAAEEFDFTTEITKNITLTAKWENFYGFDIALASAPTVAINELTVSDFDEAPTSLVAVAKNSEQTVEVTWSSLDTKVVTIDANSGAVTIVRRGVTSIKAQNKYDSASSVTIPVSAITEESILIEEAVADLADYFYSFLTVEEATEDTPARISAINYTAEFWRNTTANPTGELLGKTLVTNDGAYYDGDFDVNYNALAPVRLSDGGYYFGGRDIDAVWDDDDNLVSWEYAEPEDYTFNLGPSGYNTYYDANGMADTFDGSEAAKEEQFQGHVGTYSGLFDLENEWDPELDAARGYSPSDLYYINDDGELSYSWLGIKKPKKYYVLDGMYNYLQMIWFTNWFGGSFIPQFEVEFGEEVDGVRPVEKIHMYISLNDSGRLGTISGVYTEANIGYYGYIKFTNIGTTVLRDGLLEAAAAADVSELVIGDGWI